MAAAEGEGQVLVGQALQVGIPLGRGMRLLENSNMAVEEVARECGFLSSTYFCRFFKRETGTTPAMYRSGISGR